MDFIMKSKKRITTIVILSLLLLIFSACSNGEDASEKKDTLVLNAQWESIQFHNSVVRYLLKKDLATRQI